METSFNVTLLFPKSCAAEKLGVQSFSLYVKFRNIQIDKECFQSTDCFPSNDIVEKTY